MMYKRSSYWLFVSNEDFIAKNPEVVKRSLRALLQAEEFAGKNEDEAKVLASRGLDVQFIDDLWQKLDYTISLPQALLIAMENGARCKIQNGLADAVEVPNYLNYIHRDTLEELKPEAVTIIR